MRTEAEWLSVMLLLTLVNSGKCWSLQLSDLRVLVLHFLLGPCTLRSCKL